MNGKTVEETFGTPYDDDDKIPAHQKKSIQGWSPFGENIFKGNGQTLVPDNRLASVEFNQ